MKRLPIILILFSALILASKAQTVNLETIVNIDMQQVTLKDALNQISEKYDIKFSYSDSRLNTERIITASYNQISLNDFLRVFFADNDINYSIIDHQFVLFPFNSTKIIKVKGKVVNLLDGSPIPFANIALPETGKGTSTNEEGEFELALIKLPSELLISHLSHEKKLVYVYNDQKDLVISMMPAQKELEEVTIRSRGNKNAYYSLVKKACDKINKNRFNLQYGKAFYRQKSNRDDKYTEIFEMFYDIKYSSVGIEDWAVQEGRYAFQQDEEFDIFLYNKNFTLLTRMFPLMQPKTDTYILPVTPDVKKYFDLSLNDIIKYENRYIAIIDYKPNAMVTLPAPTGQLYIDFEDHSILKFKGRFTHPNLGIVGFNDKSSAWENYRLDFEISLIDDQADNLYLDFIKIDHSFDYFYSEKFAGKIKSNSFLTFYEQYTPTKNKKLGGPIDFKTSDMELIDRIGYNPIFWKQNPIVRRTPIEDKLIADFEQNEAFGAVFMNNNEEVVLLPDNKKSEEAEQLIARYEARNKSKSEIGLFLRLDKYHYQPDEKIHLTGYVFDKWTFRPLVMGSVITVNLKNQEGEIILSNNFDISDGAAYGEIELNNIDNPGTYTIESFTNVDANVKFKTHVNISPFSLSTNQKMAEIRGNQNEIVPEGGILLAGMPTKITYHLTEDFAGNATWKIVDDEGKYIQSIFTNDTGIGSFRLTPVYGKKYSMINDALEASIQFPEVVSSGMTINVGDNRDRSLPLQIVNKPSLPQEVYVLSSFRGKVLSVLKSKLTGQKNLIDLPIQYFQGGINDISIIDLSGKVLAQRKIYNSPYKMNIDLFSSRWRSKRSNRLELTLRITDKNGKPIKANLSASCSQVPANICEKCNISSELLFANMSWADAIDFSQTGDSLHQAIDNLLILEQWSDRTSEATTQAPYQGYNMTQSDEYDQDDNGQLFAEVSVSGSIASQNTNYRKIKKKRNENQDNDIFWIPKINIDNKGIANLDMKVPNKNKMLYINIQGLSEDGTIANQILKIDLSDIKTDRKAVSN